ncbi:hypothetical protein BU17DRAFT_70567 [Hysterangium stoloniferum]|nr:hypothetical protein BU17DRAFT_70567 [Hysterangium stoloniferum]
MQLRAFYEPNTILLNIFEHQKNENLRKLPLTFLNSVQWPMDNLKNISEILLDFKIKWPSQAYPSCQMWKPSQIISSYADVEEASVCGHWEEENLQESMVKLALKEGDNLRDEDWLPYQLKRAKKLKTNQPKEYMRGPDVMSKSKCTQCHYHNTNHNQTTLDGFIFSTSWWWFFRSVEVEIPVVPPEIEEESIEITSLLTNQEDETGWEDDLDECTQGCGVEIHSWDVL